MSYPALPDRRMPYDNDGTVIAYGSAWSDDSGGPASAAEAFGMGASGYLSGAQLIQFNGLASLSLDLSITRSSTQAFRRCLWIYFPEQREITAAVLVNGTFNGAFATPGPGSDGFEAIQASNDTTNGVDGSWADAGVSGGAIGVYPTIDGFRSITTLSFTGGHQVLRLCYHLNGGFGGNVIRPNLLHLYGQKVAGQTPNDILFLDAQNADAEFTAPIDFGDRPLGTTAVHQFKVQNASATKTANGINLQCNDTDFAISTDGVTYVATINIASLAAGAKSSVMYVRDTTPNPGAVLGPRFARIVATVSSYT